MGINDYLSILAKKLVINPDLKSKIDTSVSYLKENMWATFQDRLIDVTTFGSYDRETFIQQDKYADVDILVVFKTKDYQPETYLKQIRNICEKKYSRSDIYPNHPTVVVELEHIKFEIVPSIIYSGETVKIPAPRSKELKWIASNPKEFKLTLLKRNKSNRELLLPLIRIFKYWNSLNDNPFLSYEFERFICNRSFGGDNLYSHFNSVMESISEISKTELQNTMIEKLKERTRRLRVLDKYKIPEYIEQELQTFIPFP